MIRIFKIVITRSQIYPNTKHTDVIRSIWQVQHKLPAKITFSHICVHCDYFCVLNYLALVAQINLECDIRAKSVLHAYVRNNATMPEVLPHKIKLYCIYGVKTADSVGECMRKKTIHVECDISSKLQLRPNTHNNVPSPEGLPHDPAVYWIYGLIISDYLC